MARISREQYERNKQKLDDYIWEVFKTEAGMPYVIHVLLSLWTPVKVQFKVITQVVSTSWKE